MRDTSEYTLSPFALALLTELRKWTANLTPTTVAVREEHNVNYGGLLFEVRPVEPDTIALTVGLGISDEIDFFWGEQYRWENWTATAREVLEVCEAIQKGDVIEETWMIGPLVVERRCYIILGNERVGDGSPPMPRWLKQRARPSVRRYSPWPVT